MINLQLLFWHENSKCRKTHPSRPVYRPAVIIGHRGRIQHNHQWQVLNKPFPGALPSLTVGNRYVGVNLTYMPKVAVEKMYDSKMADESMSGIVFLQFKINVSQLMD